VAMPGKGAQLRTGTYEPERGDVVLLPAGAKHVVRSGRRLPPRAPGRKRPPPKDPWARYGHAADLLRYTTDAVGVIASEVGYDSEAAFSRVFSKRYGAPPSMWRRKPI
jgi:Helix-turn-helix domain